MSMPPPPPQSPPPRSSALSPRSVWRYSILVLALHALYLCNYSFETQQYLMQARVDAATQNYIYRLIGLGAVVPNATCYTLSVTSSLIAAWHAAGLARALRASIRFRRVLLDVPEERILHRLKTTLLGPRATTITEEVVGTDKPPFYRRWAASIGDTRREYLTMDGKHFETGTNLRKTLELATQINLMYRMSRTITEPEVNHFVIAVFTVNCWATPLIRWHFRHVSDSLPGRLHRHIVNMILASVFTIGVPGAIWGFVMPSVFGHSLAFDQLAATRVRLLLRHVMIREWSQVLSTRLAACMAILAIETFKKKLSVATPAVHPGTARVHVTDEDKEEDLDGECNPSVANVPNLVARSTMGQRRQRLAWLRVGTVFDVMWFVTGCVVLSLHVEAQSPVPLAPGIGCSTPLRPWVDAKQACAALEINCHRGATRGELADVDALLQRVDQTTVSALRFAHCPALAMPTRMQKLTDLAIFEVYNSSIVQWNSDAALSTRHHKFLGMVWLLRVTGIPSLPPGMLDDRFPSADVVISHTDVASLPDDLADRWPRDYSKLVVEYSRLTEFPRALLSMSGLTLSLAGNDLTRIPPLPSQDPFFQYMSLVENPRLSELPDASWSVFMVDLLQTNLTRLPQWMESPGSSSGVVFAGGSPVCRAATLSTKLPSGIVLDCAPPVEAGDDDKDDASALLPLAKLARERQP